MTIQVDWAENDYSVHRETDEKWAVEEGGNCCDYQFEVLRGSNDRTCGQATS